jgi:SAM-dependent methyltransferase
MKKESIDRLTAFQESIISGNSFDLSVAKSYVEILPFLYGDDLEFRLLFDWHFSPAGKQLPEKDLHPLFQFQRFVVASLGRLFGLSYQFRQFFIFHAMCNLKGKTLLEIGGSLPNEMVFDLFGVEQYINSESPDYITAESGFLYSRRHGIHGKRRTIFKNAEHIDADLQENTVDAIFSVACFEHIYDLEAALQACHRVIKNGGVLYSFFAPIYSYLTDGHHGVIPEHPSFEKTPWGLHLLSLADQRTYLINNGIEDPTEIQNFLGAVNFDRRPNRLKYEDYSRILTESPFFVVTLDDVAANCNLSKRFPEEVARVRCSGGSVGNLHTQGFRVILQKV